VQAAFFTVACQLGYASEVEDTSRREAKDAVYALHAFVPVIFVRLML
jgi:hypothetical protein